MAPMISTRPAISALALAALSLSPLANPAAAQTIYREYDDGRVETFEGGDTRDFGAAPLRRPPHRTWDDDDDERFERDDDFDAADDDWDDDDTTSRQGILDLTPPRNPAATEPPRAARKAPAPPPSVDAKPDDKAWKPAL